MDASNGKITWIGHATLLIQLGNLNFLTDPNFSSRIWPRHRRRREPGLKPRDLPPLDGILITHANYDHLDVFSFKYFKTSTPILVPKGLGKWVRRFLPNPVTELAPGGFHQERECRIHALPTLKRGKRWAGWRWKQSTAYGIESPQGMIYCPGNTGYGPHFKKIGGQQSIDVACLPIQPDPNHATGPKSSLSPAKALQAMEDLGAKVMIPIRWDAFSFGKRPGEEWVNDLQKFAEQNGLEDRIKILQPGESLDLPLPSSRSQDPRSQKTLRHLKTPAEAARLKPVDGSKGQC